MISLRFRPAIHLPAALLLILLSAGLAKADVFTIRGITVDATGQDVIDAKQIAIRQGQYAALDRLWERLVQEEDRASVPLVPPHEIDRFVQNFSVSNEKTSDVRYIADMAVQFAAQPVRNHLRFANIPFVDKPAPTAVVLPIYNDGAGELLWQAGNPWLAAWVSSFTQDSLSPVISPLGDLQDMSLIDAQRAASGDPLAINSFAERHGTENTLVARADLLDEQTVEYRFREYGTPERAGQFVLTRIEGESDEDLLLRGVAETQARLEQAWRRANTVRFDQQAQLVALIPLRDLKDWITIQEDLGAIPAIASTRIVSLTREAAIVDLSYYGPSDQLEGFFRQRRLNIRPIDFVEPEVARLLEQRSSLPTWQISRL